MATVPHILVPSPASDAPARSRPLPALGLPPSRERRTAWALASLLLHVLLIIALVTPVALHTGDVKEVAQGAGGPGPAGGGGGGNRGTGGTVVEHLQFVEVAPAQPTAQPQAVPPTPVAKPVVVPPKPIVPPPDLTRLAQTPKVQSTIQAAKIDIAELPGAGGGTGNDGTAGRGPGTGGGVGSGVGTGRGSATGPGTGGGTQANYPPSPTDLFIPPMPVPAKVHGFHLVAQFDVDASGKVLDFKFTPTPDGGYNKRLDEVFRSYRFRPGTRPDGTPIRMIGQITFDF